MGIDLGFLCQKNNHKHYPQPTFTVGSGMVLRLCKFVSILFRNKTPKISTCRDISKWVKLMPFLVMFWITCQYWQELWLGLKKFVGDNNCQIIFATQGPSWNFSLAENLKSLDFQDGPQKWHYFRNSSTPPTPPAINGRILPKFETETIGIKS